jgi:Na+/H+ antiporter NhaD/arsenite permease-like protein
MLLPFSVIVLTAVFVLVAVRRIGKVRLRIWQIVLAGAVIVLLTGQISMPAAASYVNLDVILFLIGIFILGEALIMSGYVQHISYGLFRNFRSVDGLVIGIIFLTGITSMFMLNDTIATIGTPIVMLFALKHKINPKLMLLSLAFAITIGSVASPIGNPQNLLIASSGLVSAPFTTFFSSLLIPTLINLFLAYLVLRILFKDEFRSKKIMHNKASLDDKELARLCKISITLLIASIMIYVLAEIIGVSSGLSFAYLGIIAALPIVIFSNKRIEIVKNIDWPTIIFFIALFVLVGSVYQSGFLQYVINTLHLNLASIPTIMLSNIIGSQFISNVPMVLLYLKLISYVKISSAGVMALAAGSTIAGNLFILGAASNVIIVQIAEKRYKETISFLDFAKAGAIITAINLIVYWAFLTL